MLFCNIYFRMKYVLKVYGLTLREFITAGRGNENATKAAMDFAAIVLKPKTNDEKLERYRILSNRASIALYVSVVLAIVYGLFLS